MKKQLTILFIALGLFTSAQSNFNYKRDFNATLAKTKDKNDKLFYDNLLARYLKNDSTLSHAEVLALLIGYTDKPEYKPYNVAEEKIIYDLNAEGKYYESLIRSREYMKTHPFSLKVLFEISFSYYKAKDVDSAKYYVAQGKRIFKAMAWSGDGKSKSTPMFELNPGDGQEYIYKHIGAGTGEKLTGTDPDGNSLEMVEVVFKVGDAYMLHFLTQHATSKPLELESAVEKEKREKRESEK